MRVMTRIEPVIPRPTGLARAAIAVLTIVHGLGIVGAPIAARIHFGQPGLNPHQNFHVLWEALKYFTASVLALAIARGPLARGEKWAWWASLVAVLALFGGVFVADAATDGAPRVDRVSYGAFLALALPALAVLWRAQGSGGGGENGSSPASSAAP
jgi:hypothetical protein